MTLVSVIIPCYNCQDLIGRAVQSVLNQTHTNIELLLIDNQSTDNTLEKLKQLEASFPESIKVYSEDKQGACAARNCGLRLAKGEWVQFLDADDELLPSKIEHQLALVAAHNPDLIAGSYSKIRFYKTSGGLEERMVEDILPENDLWLGLINSRLGGTSSNFWRKNTLLSLDGWNEALSSSQEYDLLFRLLKETQQVIIDQEILTIVYAQNESVSRSRNPTKLHQQYMNRYTLRCNIYSYLQQQKKLSEHYRMSLSMYLYFHLLLIGELNMNLFKEQVKQHDFRELRLGDRLRLLVSLLRNSAKRRYGNANFILKGLEWQLHFLKNLKLLFY